MKNEINELKVVNVRLVEQPSLLSKDKISNPEDAVRLVAEELKNYDREVFAILNIKTNGMPINLNICSVGTLNSALIHPREVFKGAILSNASSFIAIHNHPSGNLTISKADIDTTQKIKKCGEIFDIPLIDSIIVAGETGEYISMADRGVFDTVHMDLSSVFGEAKKDYEIEKVEENMDTPKKVYMNVHNIYAKIGLEDKKNERTFNVVSLPKGVVIGDMDLSGARIYPFDNYIYPNKLNSNLTTVQFLENQEVRVNFNDGDFEYFNAKELTDAVDLANKKYLEENREKMIEAEKEINKQKSINKSREDDLER